MCIMPFIDMLLDNLRHSDNSASVRNLSPFSTGLYSLIKMFKRSIASLSGSIRSGKILFFKQLQVYKNAENQRSMMQIGGLCFGGNQVHLFHLFLLPHFAPKCRWGNRVGGKRSSFLPTFVFRPLTPPRMRFRTWRFFIWDTI